MATRRARKARTRKEGTHAVTVPMANVMNAAKAWARALVRNDENFDRRMLAEEERRIFDATARLLALEGKPLRFAPAPRCTRCGHACPQLRSCGRCGSDRMMRGDVLCASCDACERDAAGAP